MDVAGHSSAGVRGWPRAALLAGSALLVLGAVVFGGGSGEASVAWLGSLAVALAAAAAAGGALGLLRFPALDGAGGTAAAAGLALVAWGGVTIAWSIAGDRSWDALDKGLVYAAFGVVGLALAGRGRHGLRDVALVLAGVLGIALAWALAGKAIPSLFPDGDRATRLRNPVGYWNGLALLADAAIVLGAWLAASVRGRIARPAGALLVYLAVVALLLTQSRAGVLAGLAVVGLWLWLAPERLRGAVLLLLAASAALLLSGWAFTRPALVEDGVLRADRVSDGRVFGLLLVVGAGVAVALATAVPVERLVETRRRELTRGIVGAGAVLLVAGAIGLVAAVGNPFTWAGEQIGGSGGKEVANDPGRFGSLNTNNRVAWWGEAWDVFRAHPLGGSGAHTFALARTPFREDAGYVNEPHSVPLQLLADTGIVGLALGVALAAGLGAGIVLALRRLRDDDRSAAVALVGLPAAYGLHALVDYDLDFLALTGPMLLVAWVLVGSGRPSARVPAGWPAVAGAAAAALAIVVSLVTPELAARRVDAAYAALDAGSPSRAVERARSARDLNPLSPEPLWALADVEQAKGDDRASVAYLLRATELQPENPETWYRLGIAYQLGLGDECRAYGALNHAYTLDPKSSLWSSGGALDQARDAVNAGACEPPS